MSIPSRLSKRSYSSLAQNEDIRNYNGTHSLPAYSPNDLWEADKDSSFLTQKYEQRFVGASNVTSDLKESCFLGSNSEYIVGASDDGRLYIWDRYNGETLCCWEADADILNCVQVHPSLPLLATSGLDEVIQIWGPDDLKGFIPLLFLSFR